MTVQGNTEWWKQPDLQVVPPGLARTTSVERIAEFCRGVSGTLPAYSPVPSAEYIRWLLAVPGNSTRFSHVLIDQERAIRGVALCRPLTLGVPSIMSLKAALDETAGHYTGESRPRSWVDYYRPGLRPEAAALSALIDASTSGLRVIVVEHLLVSDAAASTDGAWLLMSAAAGEAKAAGCDALLSWTGLQPVPAALRPAALALPIATSILESGDVRSKLKLGGDNLQAEKLDRLANSKIRREAADLMREARLASPISPVYLDAELDTLLFGKSDVEGQVEFPEDARANLAYLVRDANGPATLACGNVVPITLTGGGTAAGWLVRGLITRPGVGSRINGMVAKAASAAADAGIKLTLIRRRTGLRGRLLAAVALGARPGPAHQAVTWVALSARARGQQHNLVSSLPMDYI